MKKLSTCQSEHVEDRIDPNRRKILKKAAYTAPKLAVLGLLMRSPNALADASTNFPPGPPPGWTP